MVLFVQLGEKLILLSVIQFDVAVAQSAPGLLDFLIEFFHILLGVCGRVLAGVRHFDLLDLMFVLTLHGAGCGYVVAGRS